MKISGDINSKSTSKLPSHVQSTKVETRGIWRCGCKVPQVAEKTASHHGFFSSFARKNNQFFVSSKTCLIRSWPFPTLSEAFSNWPRGSHASLIHKGLQEGAVTQLRKLTHHSASCDFFLRFGAEKKPMGIKKPMKCLSLQTYPPKTLAGPPSLYFFGLLGEIWDRQTNQVRWSFS